MSGDDMRPAPDSCAADVAAYALGALDPVEAEAFARHLKTCAVCPVELTAFRQVIDDVALSVPRQRAPRSLKRRVMHAVTETPGLDPAARTRRERPWWRLAFPRPALALSGGFAVAAAVAVAVVLALPGGGSGVRTVTAAVTGTGTASLQLSHDGHAQLVLQHFRPPPHGKIYEVWLKRGSATVPTNALFSVNRRGDASVDVPGSLHGVSQVLVTPEPAGGSRVPTHAPIISASL